MDALHTKVSTWFDIVIEKIVRYKKQVLIGVLALIVAIVGLIGYSYYREWVQAAAYKDLIEALRYYDAPVASGKTVITDQTIEFGSDTDKWKKVEEVCGRCYSKHSSAGIAPMFQAYQAEALAQQGKTEAAITLLESAIGRLPSPAMKNFYALKLSLMKMDSDKDAVQKEGLLALKKIATETGNYAHEAGLYYLGYYFWNQKDYAQTKNYWQQLMVKYGSKDIKQQSGFAELVKPKLKLISAEW